MRKDTQISYRLSTETKEGLERAAQDDRRTVSSLVDKILADWLQANGYMKPIKKGAR
jgi:hypothetical protein